MIFGFIKYLMKQQRKQTGTDENPVLEETYLGLTALYPFSGSLEYFPSTVL